MKKDKDLILFSNSPGEVSTWVAPVVERLVRYKKITGEHRIFLVIHPCQFASGNEPFVAESFPGIEHIVTPKEYMRYLIAGSWKRKYGLKERGIILSLGGSLKHPVLFKNRSHAPYPLFAYTNNPDLPGKENSYEKIFVRNDWVKDKYIKRGVSSSKLVIVGDLVKSTIKHENRRGAVRRELGVSGDQILMVFMPGSRDFEVHYMLPAFLWVIDQLTDRIHTIKPFILKSPYVSYEWIETALQKGGKIKEGTTLGGTHHQEDGFHSIHFSKEKIVRILEGGLEVWGEGIDFAVTLPGSNTIQLAYRNIPLLTVMPLNKPDIIPFVGLLAVLKWIPLIGKPLIRKAALKYTGKFEFCSLPNIYQNEKIVPELFGVIETDDITDLLVDIIENGEIEKIKQRLSVFSVEEDPAEKIIRSIWSE
ncbi:MAG: hypothetical protein JSV25_06435 [Spirochaetota bacterium]|nr:MAG: hypothetical protein JSV25_06435 [Spirochaetota bacterium]